MSEPQIKRVQFPARDGYMLDASLVIADGHVKGCVQINSATGARKEIYSHFAKHLAANGYHTLIFDYRGIGGSRPASLRGFNALTQEWGRYDMAGALDWLQTQYPSLRKFVVGHSAGGQQLGLMDNHKLISAAFLVSCSTGYWNWLASPYKYFTLGVWYVLAPVFVNTIGYLPASWFRLGEDLPKGIAWEWRSWCLREDYFGSFLGKSISQHFFHEVAFPIHFIFPEDDNIATDRTVSSLQQFYKASPTTVEKLLLNEVNLKRIGHFGFFSRASKEKLWDKTLKYFESVK